MTADQVLETGLTSEENDAQAWRLRRDDGGGRLMYHWLRQPRHLSIVGEGNEREAAADHLEQRVLHEGGLEWQRTLDPDRRTLRLLLSEVRERRRHARRAGLPEGLHPDPLRVIMIYLDRAPQLGALTLLRRLMDRAPGGNVRLVIVRPEHPPWLRCDVENRLDRGTDVVRCPNGGREPLLLLERSPGPVTAARLVRD